MLVVSLSKFAYKQFSYCLVLITLMLSVNSAFAYKDESPISFGRVELGENRLPIKSKHFKLKVDVKKGINIKARLLKGSLQWVRFDDVMLMPRARLAIYIEGEASNFHFRYRGKSLLSQQFKKYAHTEFYVSLFHNDIIDIYQSKKRIGSISISAKSYPKYKKRLHLVDYSCNRRGITVEGLDGEFMSIGCKMHRIGEMGNEKPMLEVMWASPNYTLLDNSRPPYMAIFFGSQPIKIKVKDRQGKVKDITIKANVPKRLHRLMTAYGFGPYAFETQLGNETLTAPMAPALMLYFNFNLNQDTSIRGFDAFVFQESMFNNAGAYLASNIAYLLDKKLIITTLLGFQHLFFQFNSESEAVNDMIFPQGIEFLWKHAFGIKNYIVSGGAFASPSETVDYQNIWIRWGKGYYWELNYIYWGIPEEEHNAKMWGLSLGLPFKAFF
jgi:hypothetical protein